MLSRTKHTAMHSSYSTNGYNDSMFFVSLIIGKLTMISMRRLGKGGGALPGLVVERLYARFLPKSVDALPYGVIVVTGTNGKTTTTKALTEVLTAQGLRVLTNKTGSNFVRGATSAVLDVISWNGRLDYDVAVFELDEAYAVHFVQLVQPRGVVALNVMRDQMDRFGEIDTTAGLIGQVVATARDFVVLNANDPRIAALADSVSAAVHWFGHEPSLSKDFAGDDQLYAKEITFVQAAKPDVTLVAYGNHEVSLRVAGKKRVYSVLLDGAHNAMNVAAVVTATHALLSQVTEASLVAALAAIQPAFGRGETVWLPSGAELQLQLVKNPGGFRHALRASADASVTLVAICINDAYADGRDVSWLWDVDFGMLRQKRLITGGVRAYDMAVRLKYDNLATEHVYEDMHTLLAACDKTAAGQKVIVYCTYTAMLELRKALRHAGVVIQEVGL